MTRVGRFALNVIAYPAKVVRHFRHGGGWELLYVALGHFPSLPLGPKLRWMVGRSHEINFWERYFATRGLKQSDPFAERFDADRPLTGPLADLVAGIGQDVVRIIDVGSGPLTSVSRGVPGKRLEIVAVDPLARDYDRLLAMNGLEPPIRAVYAEAERLDALFADGAFDVAHAQNSIDHTHNPLAAVEAMLRVVRPGGFVLLVNSQNEAVKQGWSGLHQWNLSCEGGDFVIRGRRTRVNVTAALVGRAAVDCHVVEAIDWLIVRIAKANAGKSP